MRVDPHHRHHPPPPATIAFLFAAVGWVATTKAALVAVASLAAWHLLNAHTPRTRRPRTARAHP